MDKNILLNFWLQHIKRLHKWVTNHILTAATKKETVDDIYTFFVLIFSSNNTNKILLLRNGKHNLQRCYRGDVLLNKSYSLVEGRNFGSWKNPLSIDNVLHYCVANPWRNFIIAYSYFVWNLVAFNVKNSTNVKYNHREKSPSNKTPVLAKSINMDIWVVGTSNQLFQRFLNWNKIFRKLN